MIHRDHVHRQKKKLFIETFHQVYRKTIQDHQRNMVLATYSLIKSKPRLQDSKKIMKVLTSSM